MTPVEDGTLERRGGHDEGAQYRCATVEISENESFTNTTQSRLSDLAFSAEGRKEQEELAAAGRSF